MRAGPFNKLFLDHPRSVGESYWRHARTAGRFGAQMITGGIACMVHAAVPAWFEKTASERVKALYSQMRSRQPHLARRPLDHEDERWLPEYEI